MTPYLCSYSLVSCLSGWFNLILIVFSNRIFELIQEPGHFADSTYMVFITHLGARMEACCWWSLGRARPAKYHCAMVSRLHSLHILSFCSSYKSSQVTGLFHSPNLTNLPWNLFTTLLSLGHFTWLLGFMLSSSFSCFPLVWRYK